MSAKAFSEKRTENKAREGKWVHTSNHSNAVNSMPLYKEQLVCNI
jgi:hypothetical protein